jgi:hypothetical protein
MIWLTVVLVVVGLPLAALLFGADSRDGRDWKNPDKSLRPLPDRDLAPLHMVGAGGSALVHRRARVKHA